MGPSSLFDVDYFRGLPTREALSRSVSGPTLVLGSTQPVEIVVRGQVRRRKVDVVRRRGGGGSVFLLPFDQLWIDAWVPRSDPLWSADVSVAAERIGSWWQAGLATLGVEGCEIHRGRSVPGDLGDVVCFAGRGPGELFSEGRKVMGLSQWRSREGALFSACAYQHWEPQLLVDFLHIPDALVEELATVAVGLADVGPVGLTELGDVLLATFPSWDGGASPAS